MAEVEEADGVGLRQLAGQAGLAQEAPHRHRIAAAALVDQLDRDLAADRALPRPVHRAHAALAEQVADLEAPVDDLAGEVLGPRAYLDRCDAEDARRAAGRSPRGRANQPDERPISVVQGMINAAVNCDAHTTNAEHVI